ncbi:MAG: hypothetical protein Q7S42_00505, partial [Candidatus Omnitrophota bacterium]|nr:hypothetical protein [Candidatus Omnitrophota bacterium]
TTKKINIEAKTKEYENITSAGQLAGLILAESMKSAGIEGAKVYGAAMLAGVAVLPVAIGAKFMGRDNVQEEFRVNFDHLFEVSLNILKRMGKVTEEDKLRGIINAEVGGAQVSLVATKKSGNKTGVVISARQYFLPKPEIAGGVLYKISEKLR